MFTPGQFSDEQKMMFDTAYEFTLKEEDLEVYETEHQTGCATVLMIDISHSMILYGEDRSAGEAGGSPAN
jgi:uncharacterized protein with von Willebrand factor type A (vWA) domain